jgi:hypothetical protein
VYDVADDDDGEKDSTSCIAMNLATLEHVYSAPVTVRGPAEYEADRTAQAHGCQSLLSSMRPRISTLHVH